MTPPAPRPTTRLLAWLAAQAATRPWAVLAVVLVPTALGAWLALTRLATDANRDTLVGGDREYHRRYADYLDAFEDHEDVLVAVEPHGEAPRALAFCAALARRLDEEPLVAGHWYRVDPDEFADFHLLYLAPADLVRLRRAAADHRELLAVFENGSGFAGLFAALAHELAAVRAARPEDVDFDPAFVERLLPRLRDELTAALPYDDFCARALPRFFDRERTTLAEQGYLTSGGDDPRFLYYWIRPVKDYAQLNYSGPAVEAIRAHFEAVRAEFPGLAVGLTGLPVLHHDEMAVTNEDMTWATLATVVLVAGLFMIGFHGLARPGAAVLAILAALAWTAGAAALWPGRLNLLSVVFAIILVSLGIDFGIHLVARYQEARSARTAAEALREALVRTGPGVLTGGVTTACAFFATMGTDFEGLRELGFIAGLGVLACLAAMITVLPACLILHERFRARRRGALGGALLHGGEGEAAYPLPERSGGREPSPRRPMRLAGRLALPSPGSPAVVATAAVLAAAGIAAFALRHEFDFNLLDLQASGLESVQWERRLLEETGASSMKVVRVHESLAAARAEAERLRVLADSPLGRGIVGEVSCLSDHLPADEPRTRAQLAEIASLLAPRTAGARAPAAPAAWRAALADLGTSFYAIAEGVARKAAATPAGVRPPPGLTGLEALDRAQLETWARRLEALAVGAEDLAEALAALDEPGRARLARFERAFFADTAELLARLRARLAPPPLELARLPRVLLDQYVSQPAPGAAAGTRFLVTVSPEQNPWDRAHLTRFVTLLEAHGGPWTGDLDHLYHASLDMKNGFERAALLAVLAVVLLLWWDFRSLTATLLALVPLAVGLGWMLGLMVLGGWAFNLANFFAVPILLGIGVDDGVHLIHRYRETGDPALARRSTGRAILFTSLTTMTGFGAIAVCSRHAGMASLGGIMVLGVGTCLVAALWVLPRLLALLAPRTEASS